MDTNTQPDPLSATERSVLKLLRRFRWARAEDFTPGQLIAVYALATRGLAYLWHDQFGRRAFYAELP
jgi:hypothetical protein